MSNVAQMKGLRVWRSEVMININREGAKTPSFLCAFVVKSIVVPVDHESILSGVLHALSGT